VNQAPCRKNIVIATIGSLGDLHPCLALGRELLNRGCRVTIATTPYYRSKVEGVGLSFRAIGPDWNPTDPRLIRSCEDIQRGLEVLYRQMLLPELEHTYHDLMSATEDADLMIAGELVYAAPLAAEKSRLPWVSLCPHFHSSPDRFGEFRHTVKHAATDSFVCDLPEPPFHQIEPGITGERQNRSGRRTEARPDRRC
jgi:UDP:flavonoid glycosyltransferase YjiC (YdhE family)